MAVFYKYQYTNKRKNIHPWCALCMVLVTWYLKVRKIELIGKGQKAWSPISNFRSYLFSRPQLSTSPCGFRNICALTSTTITLHTQNKQRNKNKEQQEWRLSIYFSKYVEFLKNKELFFFQSFYVWHCLAQNFVSWPCVWREGLTSSWDLHQWSIISSHTTLLEQIDIHSLILMKVNKKNQMTN